MSLSLKNSSNVREFLRIETHFNVTAIEVIKVHIEHFSQNYIVAKFIPERFKKVGKAEEEPILLSINAAL